MSAKNLVFQGEDESVLLKDVCILNSMQRQQAYRYELRPDGAQQHAMRQFAGCCRVVYNKALGLHKETYERGSTARFSYVKLANLLPAWKQEFPWLKQPPAQTLQQALKDLERAYVNFFEKRADAPRFKKKGRSKASFRYPQPEQIKLDEANSRIFLPKLGWMRYRNSRRIQGGVRNVTISLTAGKWCMSIQTEREVGTPVHPSSSAVGVDLGVARFATLSDGTVFEPLNSFKQHEVALRKAQQSLSRKVKFSKNWHKAKKKVQRIQARIANVRKDYLHKTTTTISKNHAMVCIEDLQVSNMSKSAKGTVLQPGRNVKAKSGLNKAILDQGWGMARQMLTYKTVWNGGILVVVPPQYTSQTCPCCGYISRENRQTQAKFACVECGYENNADLVGAINILRAGQARSACQVNGDVGRQQQEPAEVIWN